MELLLFSHTQRIRSIWHMPLSCMEKIKWKGCLPAESWLTARSRRKRLNSMTVHHTTARSAQKEAVAIYILHLRRRQMNCSFIAYPAVLNIRMCWWFIANPLVGKMARELLSCVELNGCFLMRKGQKTSLTEIPLKSLFCLIR